MLLAARPRAEWTAVVVAGHEPLGARAAARRRRSNISRKGEEAESARVSSSEWAGVRRIVLEWGRPILSRSRENTADGSHSGRAAPASRGFLWSSDRDAPRRLLINYRFLFPPPPRRAKEQAVDGDGMESGRKRSVGQGVVDGSPPSPSRKRAAMGGPPRAKTTQKHCCDGRSSELLERFSSARELQFCRLPPHTHARRGPAEPWI